MEVLINTARLKWDLSRRTGDRFESYWENRYQVFPPRLFENNPKIRLEIGAGSGGFIVDMATRYPDEFFIAIERCRIRSATLVKKSKKSGLNNLASFRGNAIPALMNGVPDESIDSIYILYPCPWEKTAHRKNRWYLHPLMPHLVRVLKKGGLLIWASDQKFYIDEAEYVSREHFGLETLVWGPLSENPYNDLAAHDGGRTKFEKTFRAEGLSCHELISRKN